MSILTSNVVSGPKDLFVISGESNGGGNADDALAFINELGNQPTVKIFNNTTKASFDILHLSTIGDGLDNTHVGHIGTELWGAAHGLELQMAQRVKAGNFGTTPCYIAKTAQGGTKISQWAVGGTYTANGNTVNCWQVCMDRIDAAIPILTAINGGTAPKIYLIWSQAINDAISGTVVATWKQATKDHFVKFRARYGNVPIIQTRFDSITGAVMTPYNAAIDQIATEMTEVYVADSLNCAMKADGNHWQYAGMKVMSDRVMNILEGNYPTLIANTQKSVWANGNYVIGDSETVPSGATYSWWDLVNTAKAVTGIKYASAGQGMTYAITTLFTNLPLVQNNPLVTFIGFNDTRVASGQALRYEHVKAGHRALGALQFTSWLQLCNAANTNVTYSSGASDAANSFVASWRSRALWFQSNGFPTASFFLRISSVLNETVTIANIPQSTGIAIGTWGFSSLHPATKFTVTVDGVLKLTYDPMNRTDETIAQDINDVIVITGLANTTHTVVIQATEAGKLFGIDWIATLKTPAQCVAIPMYVLDLIHMIDQPSIGYNYPGNVTTQVILDGCTAARKADLQATFPGYPIVFVDINTTYTPSGINTQADGIHMTQPGQQLVANRVLNYLT